MRKICLLISALSYLLTVTISCKTVSNNDPKSVAQAFTEAMVKEDFDEVAKYATKESLSTIEMLKSAAKIKKMFGGKEGELNVDFFQGAAGKKLTYSNPKMEGSERATITVLGNGKELRPLILKKEENIWKVAIDISTIMDVERTNLQDDPEPILNQADSVLKDLGGMNDSIDSRLKEAQKALDSLSKALKNQ